VKITAIGPGRAGARAAGDFLRYIQYRDRHVDSPLRVVDAALRYVAHRDHSVAKGMLFGPAGPADDRDRRSLQAYIARSIKGVPPPERRTPYSDRACYRFVISPAYANGLDLQAVTRAALQSLATDLGPTANLPAWIAAEHRNTAHPHVHVVLAARREVAPGRFRAVALTRPRLRRMKEAVYQEIVRQRGDRRVLEGVRVELFGRRSRGTRSLVRHGQLHRVLGRRALAAHQALREYEQEAERELERTVEDEVQRSRARSPR